MYRLIVENSTGSQLELTNNKSYDVLSVSGTSPPVATINTADIAGMDGSKFNSARINQRNLVITLNIHQPIEKNRIKLYTFFRLKNHVKIYYKNPSRDVYTEGYVESFENNLWSELQQPQISIICPNPFWLSTSSEIAHFSNSIALFEFPFSIPSAGIEFSRLVRLSTAVINAGEVETGGIFQLYAAADGIIDPVFYNRTTQKYFKLNYTMMTGDRITINTEKGKKAVTLLRGGVVSNLLSSRADGSDWIQFQPGMNEISFDAEEHATDLRAVVTVTPKYEGV